MPPGKPLDIVLVMGYTDLLKGHSRKFMMECFQLFTSEVMELGKEKHPDTPNTISVATLMYPPKLAWFYDNGPEPQNYLNECLEIPFVKWSLKDQRAEKHGAIMRAKPRCYIALECAALRLIGFNQNVRPPENVNTNAY